MAKWDPLRKTKRDEEIYQFWLANKDDWTQEQIAKRWHMTRPNVSRIIKSMKARETLK